MSIQLQPDPPREGAPVKITVVGRGPYSFSIDGGAWQPLPIDEETGSATINLPPGSGGQILDVSDRRVPEPDDASAVIVSK
jgi:hypothetical protein